MKQPQESGSPCTNGDQMLLSRGRTALRLGIPESTLAHMAVDGNGPKMVKIGARVYYRLTDLEDWIDSHLVGSTTEAANR